MKLKTVTAVNLRFCFIKHSQRFAEIFGPNTPYHPNQYFKIGQNYAIGALTPRDFFHHLFILRWVKIPTLAPDYPCFFNIRENFAIGTLAPILF